MRANINNAPLVIKKRKTTRIRFQGEQIGERDNLVLDMSKQGLSDVIYYMQGITIQDTQKEIDKGNDPNILVVDNRDGKALRDVQRKTEVYFGDKLDKLLIKTIQRNLSANIRSRAGNPADRALGNIAGNFEWLYSETSRGTATPVDINRVTTLPRDSFLVLRPTNNTVGIADMLAARKDAGWPSSTYNGNARNAMIKMGEEKAFGDGEDKRSGGVGFMGYTTQKLKRLRLMKNYTIYAVFTQAYKLPDELYSHGTPVIVLRAKRKRGYYRKPKVRR